MSDLKILSFYQRFEQLVALILTFLMSVVIVMSLFHLSKNIVLLFNDLAALQQSTLQNFFGMMMSVLIALEFKHSILKVIARSDSIIQVKTVVLIAILAISRKFIILDIEQHAASTIFALAASILSLGIVYWLMREPRDNLNQRMQTTAKSSESAN